jgi:hypothetical protein
LIVLEGAAPGPDHEGELTSQLAVRGRAGSLEIYRMSLLGGRGDLA